MNFRRKLLAVFAVTVFLSVAAVTGIVSAVTRKAFEQADDERATALAAQFRREFARRGEEIARRVQAIAAGNDASRMALALSQGSPDYAAFLNTAKNIAADQQLDFLEFVDAQGTILSSAQWPAKFGYKDSSFPGNAPANAFLQEEALPEGSVLGLSAIREVDLGGQSLFVIGGRRLDKEFLAGLDVPSGTRLAVYQNLGPGFSSQMLIDPSGTLQQPEKLAPLIQQVQQQRQEAGTLIHWSANPVDDETVHAIPLAGQDNQLLGILLVGNSRRAYVELRPAYSFGRAAGRGGWNHSGHSVQRMGCGPRHAAGGTAGLRRPRSCRGKLERAGSRHFFRRTRPTGGVLQSHDPRAHRAKRAPGAIGARRRLARIGTALGA